eukprot:TRINITY_DN8275_c0_g1_i1.p1 TRINITY_DN8275_c0_g1~~TRINITY_DN8275_c0_g1_i1.p1  ORF type:complete len:303 (-),score=57.56 TRINITY_DN8275_c0_g1_i1:6-857(-)
MCIRDRSINRYIPSRLLESSRQSPSEDLMQSTAAPLTSRDDSQHYRLRSRQYSLPGHLAGNLASRDLVGQLDPVSFKLNARSLAQIERTIEDGQTIHNPPDEMGQKIQSLVQQQRMTNERRRAGLRSRRLGSPSTAFHSSLDLSIMSRTAAKAEWKDMITSRKLDFEKLKGDESAEMIYVEFQRLWRIRGQLKKAGNLAHKSLDPPEMMDPELVSTLIKTKPLEYPDFKKKYVEQITRHETCGPTCNHLERFYSWIETLRQDNTEKRQGIDVKKVVIDRILPE